MLIFSEYLSASVSPEISQHSQAIAQIFLGVDIVVAPIITRVPSLPALQHPLKSRNRVYGY
ncbi:MULTISPECIES: hypothetical protein [Limnospira]|uniref:hypothetical protein n=1 Tax=Limnospira TaxID=2596745 RepID=UPI0012666574|nr:hypothetical protein [Limnospira indica]MDY7051824.1 hypothetical protein [Limnospira fusiformis LS22]QJB24465.1 hypothetical protein HFV01_00030 [Limnospira fusiformis SAG 85.79]QNH57351.1 MAG: hypothetical protein H2674_25200 [Limnospira indica BM01]